MNEKAKELSNEHQNAEFPYVKISVSDAEKEIVKLSKLNYQDLITEPSEDIQFGNGFVYAGKKLFMIKQTKLGNKISNKFFQEERMKASMANHPSPIEVWKDNDKRTRLFNSMIKLNKGYLSKNEAQLRSAMRLYYSVVPQFKVSVAKCIYSYFSAKSVLDFSAGWGDRLTAFLSCKDTISYTGIDANKSLEPCYQKLLKLHNTAKEIEMIYLPAETVILERKYDMIFTSPPYFELEKYSNDSNQSNVKYNSLENWLNNFLFKVLRNNIKNLSGTLAIQISDYKKGGKRICIIEPMMEFISANFPECKYQGIIVVASKGRKTKSIYEPIIVFSK